MSPEKKSPSSPGKNRPPRKKKQAKLWGGRFRKALNPEVEQWQASISFDKRLYRYDIQGSVAHARMLGTQKLIRSEEADLIIRGLQELQKREGEVELSEKAEDIHMNLETLLTQSIDPETAGKLHTGRSRNDQVALDTKLYTRDQIDIGQEHLKALIRRLEKLSAFYKDCPMPGYTHLQRAQPTSVDRHLGAWKAMLERDAGRLADTRRRLNRCPLGAGALAGSTLPLNREQTARDLGFDGPAENTLDAVSDRDFCLEYMSAASICMMHLSRISEELILWSSTEFDFIHMDDAFATGSSLMPNKKNPDIPELIRGKTGRVYGNLFSLLTVMKGLPLAYNKDMQEDKEALFDTADTLNRALRILCLFLQNIRFKTNRLKNLAFDGFITATYIADYLVLQGLPFRRAHEVVGCLIAYCEKEKKPLSSLRPGILKTFSPHFGAKSLKTILRPYLKPSA